MNSCIKCHCYTNQVIITDDKPHGIYICNPCLEIEITNTLNELIEDGVVISEHDPITEDKVYRLRKNV